MVGVLPNHIHKGFKNIKPKTQILKPKENDRRKPIDAIRSAWSLRLAPNSLEI